MADMKTDRLIILAGGIASRMKAPSARADQIDARLLQDAQQRSKGMIRVGESRRPFLDYLLYNSRAAGYRDIVIVTGVHDQSIRQHYGLQERANIYHGLSISYATQTIPPGRQKPLGTADALLQALLIRDDWRGATFIVCNGDNLYSQRALALLATSSHRNAMIDYDRDGLQFEKSRVQRFAITEKDEEGYLVDIIEKPSSEQVARAVARDATVGVSMNIFRLDYDLVLPFLQAVPLHSVRGEKELPAAVVMMAWAHPKSVWTIPLREHVPDLTQPDDLEAVQNYLGKEFRDAEGFPPQKE
ncbi:MAG: sugar phosphate nucleotidyltransferase [bacterium]